MTLVHRKFVPVLADTGRLVKMRKMTENQIYPIAVSEIDLDGHHYRQEVGLSEQLQEDALLGMDVSLWSHLV